MKILKIYAIMAVCLLLAACGGGDAASVMSKIADGSKLSEKDYEVMIDYCGKYAEEAQSYQDQIDAISVDSPEAAKATDALSKLTGSKEYLKAFSAKVSECNQSEIGEKNIELINKYSSYIWFPSPSWANVETSSDNVEGYIEDMPSSDTGQVISSGAGEVVEETVK